MIDIIESRLDQHSTLVSVAALIVAAMESYDLNTPAILQQAGLDPDKVYNPSGRIPTRKMKKLWELAIVHSGDPCIGLTFANYIQPSALHGLGFSWLASHTLVAGLERLVRFQQILATELKVEIRKTTEGYCIIDTLGNKNDPYQFPDAAVDSGLASIYRIVQIMMGPDIKPLRVSLEHPAPQCAAKFDEFFDIPVQFDAPETAIVFSSEFCEMPAPAANPELARFNDRIVIDYLQQFERDDVVNQTRKHIIDLLPSGLPKQSTVASQLNMSLRNFQRKLSRSGTSYGDLLDRVRYEMACDYLKSPHHQIIKIAYLLGYSDPSNFARAFKRWDGLSPTEYREKALHS